MNKQVILLSVFAALIFSSCSKNIDDTHIINETDSPRAFVLNNGSWGGNNSNLVVYDFESGNVSQDIFLARNGRKLGDNANDFIVYGSKLYIAVNASGVVFVTDLDGKILNETTISGENGNLMPRRLCADGDKVYVTYQEGYLAQIDTATYAVQKINVGPYPEGVAACNGELFVAVSDALNPDYGNMVAVVYESKFSAGVTSTIQVNKNPQTFTSSGTGCLYLVCFGNYADEAASLVKIDCATHTAHTIPDIVPTEMAGNGSRFCILSSVYDEFWNNTVKYYDFSPVSDKLTGETVNPKSITPNGYSVSVSSSGYVFIGASDYTNNGDVYIIDDKGSIVNKFDSNGIGPKKVVVDPRTVNAK